MKKIALDALDIKVNASIDDVEIPGVLPLTLSTTEQTLGRTEHHTKLHVLISAEIREHRLGGQTLLLA